WCAPIAEPGTWSSWSRCTGSSGRWWSRGGRRPGWRSRARCRWIAPTIRWETATPRPASRRPPPRRPTICWCTPGGSRSIGPRAAAIFVEIGDIYEKRLSDDENARKAYERALSRDERCLPALESLAGLHRKHKRTPELLDVLRRELKLAPDKSRQLELLLEI